MRRSSRSRTSPAMEALEKEFLTAGELARVLAVSEKTVRRLVQRGALPSYQIGRARRFRRSDVEVFLASCRTGARAQPTRSEPRVRSA